MKNLETEFFFCAFVRFTFSPFSGSHIPQCGLTTTLLLFITSWSWRENKCVRHRRPPNNHVKSLLPESTAPIPKSHLCGALPSVGWQYAGAKDTELQRCHAHCPKLTQFFSSLHGTFSKWMARDRQANVSLLSLNPIILPSSSLKNWKKRRI